MDRILDVAGCWQGDPPESEESLLDRHLPPSLIQGPAELTPQQCQFPRILPPVRLRREDGEWDE